MILARSCSSVLALLWLAASIAFSEDCKPNDRCGNLVGDLDVENVGLLALDSGREASLLLPFGYHRKPGSAVCAVPRHGRTGNTGPRFIGDAIFNANITAIFGSGNSDEFWTASSGSYSLHKSDYLRHESKHLVVEVGLRAKKRFNTPQNPTSAATGGIYGPFGVDGSQGCICRFDANISAGCWNFDWTINSDRDANTIPGSPLGKLAYELCVDNSPNGVNLYCFDPVNSFDTWQDHSFGNYNTVQDFPSNLATSLPQYVAYLKKAKNIAQNSYNPSFPTPWGLEFPATLEGCYTVSLTAFARVDHSWCRKGMAAIARTSIEVCVNKETNCTGAR